jgi:hypothetical protein
MSAPAVKIVLKRGVFGTFRAKAGTAVIRPADEAAKLVKLGIASYVTPPAQLSGKQTNGK